MRLGTATTTTMTAVFLLVGVAWVFSVRRMTGMGMGSGLGSLSFFVVTWTAMMAAMMLPSALPAARGLDGRAPLAFAVSYITVWALRVSPRSRPTAASTPPPQEWSSWLRFTN